MKPKLLVVDDEPGILEMIQSHFGSRGYDVRTAEDGSIAAGLARRFLPDIILLDLKMKHVDGDQVLPELREACPKAKIFVVTAYRDDSIDSRPALLAADDYFEKPVSILDLEKKIREALRF